MFGAWREPCLSCKYAKMNDRYSKNYLVIKADGVVEADLFRLAIKYAEKSQTVLYLSARTMKKLPDIEKPEKEILKRIIFMYFNEIQQLTEKFLELHTWSIVPTLVIVDSLQDFHCRTALESEIDKYILSIASLLNCMHYLGRKSDRECTSVVLIDQKLKKIDWQIIVDLFYYKNTLNDLEGLLRSIEPVDATR